MAELSLPASASLTYTDATCGASHTATQSVFCEECRPLEVTKYSSGVCLSTRGWEYDHKPDSVDIFKMMQPSYYDGSKRPTRYYLATTEGRVARLTRTFNVRWKLFPSTSTTCSCAERRNHPIDERDGESVPRLSLAQHQSIGAPQ